VNTQMAKPSPQLRLRRALAERVSEATLPRSSAREVDAMVADRLADAFRAAGWRAPKDWHDVR
jgi:hypothetical protein